MRRRRDAWCLWVAWGGVGVGSGRRGLSECIRHVYVNVRRAEEEEEGEAKMGNDDAPGSGHSRAMMSQPTLWWWGGYGEG